MNISINDIIEGEHSSATIQPLATTSPSPIKLVFPSMTDMALQRMRKLSMLIDTCIIQYRPQCPHNASGTMRVIIHDNRVTASDSKQAEFVFPVSCSVNLKYYGNSYASMKEKECPWTATYQLEHSNIRATTHFCKIKAYLKLTTTKIIGEIPFRPPDITVLTERFTTDDVDIWHCDYASKTHPLLSTIVTGSYLIFFINQNNIVLIKK